MLTNVEKARRKRASRHAKKLSSATTELQREVIRQEYTLKEAKRTLNDGVEETLAEEQREELAELYKQLGVEDLERKLKAARIIYSAKKKELTRINELQLKVLVKAEEERLYEKMITDLEAEENG